MGLKLEFTIKLPGATKVALRVDHDKDGLIDDEKEVDLKRAGDEWRGTAELAGDDPEGVLYVYAVTTSQESAQFKVTVVRCDNGDEVGASRTGTIPQGKHCIAHWVGGP